MSPSLRRTEGCRQCDTVTVDDQPHDDEASMRAAIELAASVRTSTAPNPWVGCVLVAPDGTEVGQGATQAPGGQHAESVALAQAGRQARGATAYVTLEPCSHRGRTAPCADALIAAGVARAVIGVIDPDPNVAGRGLERLRAAGVDVTVGVAADDVARQLAPYLHHRRTGRPLVVLKLAATVDGRTAAPDGTSQWITGPAARRDAHGLRAESDAIVVGAGTVRTDDPRLTVRHMPGAREPLRVVLGRAPHDAQVRPCLERQGNLGAVLDELGTIGCLQVLVEGGATVAGEFHRRGLVDRYVIYLAPALFGGDDAAGLFRGAGAGTISDVWRGEIDAITQLGQDVRVDLVPRQVVL